MNGSQKRELVIWCVTMNVWGWLGFIALWHYWSFSVACVACVWSGVHSFLQSKYLHLVKEYLGYELFKRNTGFRHWVPSLGLAVALELRRLQSRFFSC